jgi:hypothetical protein
MAKCDCPTCGAQLPAVPPAGSFAVCAGCGAICVIQQGEEVRVISQDELNTVKAENPHQYEGLLRYAQLGREAAKEGKARGAAVN